MPNATRLRLGTDEPGLWAFYTEYTESGLSTLRYVLRHPLRGTAAVVATLRLPRLRVRLSAGPDGLVLRDQLLRHGMAGTRFGTLGAAVLEVPADPPGHLAEPGSSRKTLRKKLRYAQRRGITGRRVDDGAERVRLLALGNEAERSHPDARYRTEAPDNADLLEWANWFAAFDADGTPLLLAVTATDGEWGLLRYFRTLGTGPAHSDSRYLLFWTVLEDLSARGVRHLFATETPVDVPNGLRHFQRMLGFRLVRLVLRGTPAQPAA